MFNSTEQIQPSDPPKNPIIAAILSLLLGGIGQLYLGQQKKGIILIVAWIVTWIIPCVGPIIISILGAIDAYMLADKLQKGETIGDMQWFWE
jgi:TM2 domain-containing membrane protein YozV